MSPITTSEGPPPGLLRARVGAGGGGTTRAGPYATGPYALGRATTGGGGYGDALNGGGGVPKPAASAKLVGGMYPPAISLVEGTALGAPPPRSSGGRKSGSPSTVCPGPYTGGGGRPGGGLLLSLM